MAVVLRILYASFFAAVAIEFVFLPYYFTARGLSAAEIGILFTGRTIAVILFQPKSSELADRLQRPHTILKAAIIAQFVGAVALSFADGFWGLASVIWLQAAFRAPVVPVIDSTTVRTVGAERYGVIRLWGSLGFGVCAAWVGRLAQEMDYDEAGQLALLLYVVITACAAMVALPLPRERPRETRRSSRPVGLFGTPFLLFIAWNALHWMAISVYNGFFSLHTKALGLASDVPGDAMGIAILGEAAAFWFAPRLFQRYGSAPWVVAAILISALRWWLTAHTEDGATIVWLQLLHFFSFGVWYAAAIDRLGVFAGPEHRATYQGVFSAGVLSLGAIVGFLGGGWLLDVAGGAVLFRVAAGCDLLAAGVALAAWRVWARPG